VQPEGYQPAVAIIDAVVGGGVVQGLDAGGRVKGVNGELYVLRRRGRGIHVHQLEQIGKVRRPGQCKLQGIDQEEVQRRSQAAADAEEEGCSHGAVAGRGVQGLLRLRQGISRKGEGCLAYFQCPRLLSSSSSSSSLLLSLSSTSLLSSLSSLLLSPSSSSSSSSSSLLSLLLLSS
jgi:hypothetical protein